MAVGVSIGGFFTPSVQEGVKSAQFAGKMRGQTGYLLQTVQSREAALVLIVVGGALLVYGLVRPNSR
jgi:hypothetical protein